MILFLTGREFSGFFVKSLIFLFPSFSISSTHHQITKTKNFFSA
jgi:hypothetical protein